jgi:hypothetical protein
LTSSAASSSTIPDVLHARLYCSLGRSACSRRIATSLASRATSLHIVALYAVQLLLRFQLPNPCSPGLATSLPRSHTRVRAIWAYSCPGRATRARAPTAPPAPSARAPLNTCTRHRLPLRYRAHVRATRSALLTFAPALPVVPLTSLRHTRTSPACWARARLLLGRAASTSCTTCAFTRPRALARSRAPPRLPRTLRAPAVVHARATSPAPARASSAPEPRTNAGLPPSCARSRSPSSCRGRFLCLRRPSPAPVPGRLLPLRLRLGRASTPTWRRVPPLRLTPCAARLLRRAASRSSARRSGSPAPGRTLAGPVPRAAGIVLSRCRPLSPGPPRQCFAHLPWLPEPVEERVDERERRR